MCLLSRLNHILLPPRGMLTWVDRRCGWSRSCGPDYGGKMYRRGGVPWTESQMVVEQWHRLLGLSQEANLMSRTTVRWRRSTNIERQRWTCWNADQVSMHWHIVAMSRNFWRAVTRTALNLVRWTHGLTPLQLWGGVTPQNLTSPFVGGKLFSLRHHRVSIKRLLAMTCTWLPTKDHIFKSTYADNDSLIGNCQSCELLNSMSQVDGTVPFLGKLNACTLYWLLYWETWSISYVLPL